VSETEAADRLAAMIADLEGFIDRRAAVLAAPLIEEARRRQRGRSPPPGMRWSARKT